MDFGGNRVEVIYNRNSKIIRKGINIMLLSNFFAKGLTVLLLKTANGGDGRAPE